jgi:regulator of sigma E protease
MVGILAGLVLLCVLVVVHEFGHFLVAKALGVRVLTFSVGFGPKIWSFKRGDTEYCLSAILLGGYVKMFGESHEDVLKDEDKKYSFLYQSLWKKSAIAVAGPLFNFILPLVLFFFVFWGNETVLVPIVGTVLPDEPAALAGVQAGDRIKAIDGLPVSNFTDLVERVSKSPGRTLRFDIERMGHNGKAEALSIPITPSSDPDTNPLAKGEFVGRIGVMPAIQKPIVAVTNPDSEAAKAGFKDFDEVVAINGKPVVSASALMSLLRQNAAEPLSVNVKRTDAQGKAQVLSITLPAQGSGALDFALDPSVKRFAVTEDETESSTFGMQVAQTQALLKQEAGALLATRGLSFVDGTMQDLEPDSTATELGLRKGDRIVSVDGKLTPTWAQIHKLFDAQPDGYHIIGVLSQNRAHVMAFRLKTDAAKSSSFGALPRKVFGHKIVDAYKEGTTQVQHVGVFAAIKRSFLRTGDLIWLTVKSLWMLVSFEVPASQLGGPIAIFGVAGQAAAAGLTFYVYVMSLVSINLGMLNLLPVPVLDGGHLLLFGIEAVQRRPLTLRTRQIATQIGLVFVLALMALALFNDISRLVSPN